MFSTKCNSTARLDGKTAVITGCNTGIGKETVKDFYKRGARVIMACRTVSKAEEAKSDIEVSCKDLVKLGQIVIVKLDLTSLSSVRECAQHILDTEKQVNILLNNAGVFWAPQGKTEDGYETHFATNHLAHFLFTLLLLPRIRNSTPARIVTVSSALHSYYSIDLDDLNSEKRAYSPAAAYADSKTANILFTRELDVKLKENQIPGITTYSLHPGLVKTDGLRHMESGLAYCYKKTVHFFSGMFVKTAEQGAQTNIYCCVDEKCAEESGLYYAECKPTKPSKKARNAESARKLWELSEEMVKLGDFNPFTAPDTSLKKSTAIDTLCPSL